MDKDKKAELVLTLNDRKKQYSRKVRWRGVLFLFEDSYYPVKLFFLPCKDDVDYEPKELNYGDLLLIEDGLSIDTFAKFIDSLGEDSEFEISSYHVRIPKGYFRAPNEDQNKIFQLYGSSSPLSDFQKKLLTETRSFPKSIFRQWPTKVDLFTFQVEHNCNSLYRQKSWDLMPLKDDLPAVPEYRTTVNWWLGKEMHYLDDWMIAFYLPDFHARIKNVKSARDRFIVDIEEGILKKENLGGKYYLEYADLSSAAEDIDFMNTNQVPIKENVQRFYFVLYSKSAPRTRIDYRDYNWRHVAGAVDRAAWDIEYEEENIDYWVTQGENEEVEYKLEVEKSSMKEFLESVCSFSNGNGGRIFIGVDNNCHVKGLDERQIERYQKSLLDLIRHWIEPQVRARIEVTEVREKKIIIAGIPKGSDPPYNYKEHGIYIRASSNDRIATRDEILSLMSLSHKPVGDGVAMW